MDEIELYIEGLKDRLSKYLDESDVKKYIRDIYDEIIEYEISDNNKLSSIVNEYIIKKINDGDFSFYNLKINGLIYDSYDEVEEKIILYSLASIISRSNKTINERIERCCLDLDISLLDYVTIMDSIEKKTDENNIKLKLGK